MLASAVAVRICEVAAVAPSWMSSWVDDVVALPLVLHLVLVCHRLTGCSPTWRLPRIHGLSILILYGVFFEGAWPLVARSAVADPLDLAAYAAGWLVFEAFLNVPGGGAGLRPGPDGPKLGSPYCGPSEEDLRPWTLSTP